MFRKPWMLLIAFFLCVRISLPAEGNCAACHAAKGVQERAFDIAPIIIRDAGKVRRISLADAFRFHGHSCPGLTATFRALQYGISLLFDQEIPDRQDIAIISKAPLAGGLDFLDLVMLGEKRAARTVPPQGMKSSPDTIGYTLFRKSTSTAVDIQLKPEHYPADFFDYKKKQSEKKLTEAEWQVFHGYMRDMILKFPTMPPESLFGRPRPYKTIMWGTLMPAHNSLPKSGSDD